MQVLILAAGQGTRLEAIHQDQPKSLISVLGTPYLKLQLQALTQFDLSQITVVGGFEFDQLQSFLKSCDFANVKLIENPDYKKGNLISFLTAQNLLLKDDLVLFNADHYYSLSTYKKLLSPLTYPIEACYDTDRQLTDDDMKIIKEGDSFVQFSKAIQDLTYGYVGVTRVQKSFLPHYLQACKTTLQDNGEATHVEQVLNELSAQGVEVHGLDISGSWWTEIDTPEDYQKAVKIIEGDTHA